MYNYTAVLMLTSMCSCCIFSNVRTLFYRYNHSFCAYLYTLVSNPRTVRRERRASRMPEEVTSAAKLSIMVSRSGGNPSCEKICSITVRSAPARIQMQNDAFLTNVSICCHWGKNCATSEPSSKTISEFGNNCCNRGSVRVTLKYLSVVSSTARWV